uniref:Uncharacterized protein ALNC14_054100 n=1 Tax=Albugo laibachii Nc14 TaxID=890382 RepID=F0WDJ3_9STRA|nr:unnamed protein product [Albugo laibachii Nc14]|eukprot:CCA19267.1 unnamed protein product [Albugo laibachii Nc14]
MVINRSRHDITRLCAIYRSNLLRTTRRYASSTTSCADRMMEDEYSDTKPSHSVNEASFRLPSLQLQSGATLSNVNIRYATYGQLAPKRDNVVVLCHALTGHPLVHQYWDAFVSRAWTDRYFVICTNILGSCYGTTGPRSIDPNTNRSFGPNFPFVTIRDAVRAQIKLLEYLGIENIKAVIGGSLGGMQTLEWALLAQEESCMNVQNIVPIACSSQHTAWQIAFNELQRQAIRMDPLFCDGNFDPKSPPNQGFSLARQIAMVSYRTHQAYVAKYGREKHSGDHQKCQDSAEKTSKDSVSFLVQSYLHYQGEKFLSRFDVNSYMTLSHMMDSHDIGRDRGGINQALNSIKQPALVIGVDTDVLYPITEQEELAQDLPNATLKILDSKHGHDAFLLEQERISEWTWEFLRNI